MKKNIIIAVLCAIVVILAFKDSSKKEDNISSNQYKVLSEQYLYALNDTQVALLSALKTIASNSGVVELNAIVTAYTPDARSCFPYADGRTSIGKDAKLPGVAVNPSLIPYGSLVIINGLVYEADDTGSAMRKSLVPHVDIRMQSHNEAMKFGKQRMKIKVVPL